MATLEDLTPEEQATLETLNINRQKTVKALLEIGRLEQAKNTIARATQTPMAPITPVKTREDIILQAQDLPAEQVMAEMTPRVNLPGPPLLAKTGEPITDVELRKRAEDIPSPDAPFLEKLGFLTSSFGRQFKYEKPTESEAAVITAQIQERSRMAEELRAKRKEVQKATMKEYKTPHGTVRVRQGSEEEEALTKLITELESPPSRIAETRTEQAIRVFMAPVSQASINMNKMLFGFPTVRTGEETDPNEAYVGPPMTRGLYTPVEGDMALNRYRRQEAFLREAYKLGGGAASALLAAVMSVNPAVEVRYDPEKSDTPPPTSDLLIDAAASIKKGESTGNYYEKMPISARFWESLGMPNAPKMAGDLTELAFPIDAGLTKGARALASVGADIAGPVLRGAGYNKTAKALDVVAHPLLEIRNYRSYKAVEDVLDETTDWSRVDTNLAARASDNVTNKFVNDPSSTKSALRSNESTTHYADVLDNAEDTLNASVENARQYQGFNNNAFDVEGNLVRFASQLSDTAPKALKNQAAILLENVQSPFFRGPTKAGLRPQRMQGASADFLRELSENELYFNRYKKMYYGRNLMPKVESAIAEATGGNAWRFLGGGGTIVRADKYDEAMDILEAGRLRYTNFMKVENDKYLFSNSEELADVITTELGATKVANSKFWTNTTDKLRNGQSLTFHEAERAYEAMADSILRNKGKGFGMRPKNVSTDFYRTAKVPPERRKAVLAGIYEVLRDVKGFGFKLQRPGRTLPIELMKFHDEAANAMKDPARQFMDSMMQAPDKAAYLESMFRKTVHNDPEGMLGVMRAIYADTLPKSAERYLKGLKLPPEEDALMFMVREADKLIKNATPDDLAKMKRRRRTLVGIYAGTGAGRLGTRRIRENENLTESVLAYVIEKNVQKPAIEKAKAAFIDQNPEFVFNTTSKQMVDRYLDQVYRGEVAPNSLNTVDIARETVIAKLGEEAVVAKTQQKILQGLRRQHRSDYKKALDEARETQQSLREASDALRESRKITQTEKAQKAAVTTEKKAELAGLRAEKAEAEKLLRQEYKEKLAEQDRLAKGFFGAIDQSSKDVLKDVNKILREVEGELIQPTVRAQRETAEEVIAAMEKSTNKDLSTYRKVLSGFRASGARARRVLESLKLSLAENPAVASREFDEFVKASDNFYTNTYRPLRAELFAGNKARTQELFEQSEKTKAAARKAYQDAIVEIRKPGLTDEQYASWGEVIDDAFEQAADASAEFQRLANADLKATQSSARKLYDNAVTADAAMSDQFIKRMKSVALRSKSVTVDNAQLIEDAYSGTLKEQRELLQQQQQQILLQNNAERERLKAIRDANKEKLKELKKEELAANKRYFDAEKAAVKARGKRKAEAVDNARKARQAQVDSKIARIKEQSASVRETLKVMRNKEIVAPPPTQAEIDALTKTYVESRAGQSLRDMNAYIMTSGSIEYSPRLSSSNELAYSLKQLGDSDAFLALPPEFAKGWAKWSEPSFIEQAQKKFAQSEHDVARRIVEGGVMDMGGKLRRRYISGLLGGPIGAPTFRYFGVNNFTAPTIAAITTPGFTGTTMRAIPSAFYAMLPEGTPAIDVARLVNKQSMGQLVQSMGRALPRAYEGFKGFLLDEASGVDVKAIDSVFTSMQNVRPGARGLYGIPERFVTRDGRVYSREDVFAMAREEQFMNQVTFELGGQLLREIQKTGSRDKLWQPMGGLESMMSSTLGRNMDLQNYWNQAGYTADRAFRESVFIESMKRGYTRDESRMIADNVLLDYSDIPDPIRNEFAKHAVFFSFFYKSATELMSAAVRPDAMNNLARLIRVQDMMYEPVKDYMFPDYTRARLGMFMPTDVGAEALATAGPGAPPLESLVTLATVLDQLERTPAVPSVFLEEYVRRVGSFTMQQAFETLKLEMRTIGNPEGPGSMVPYTYVQAAATCSALPQFGTDCLGNLAETFGWVPITGREVMERQINPTTTEGIQYRFKTKGHQKRFMAFAFALGYMKADRVAADYGNTINSLFDIPALDSMRAQQTSGLMQAVGLGTSVRGYTEEGAKQLELRSIERGLEGRKKMP